MDPLYPLLFLVSLAGGFCQTALGFGYTVVVMLLPPHAAAQHPGGGHRFLPDRRILRPLPLSFRFAKPSGPGLCFGPSSPFS